MLCVTSGAPPWRMSLYRRSQGMYLCRDPSLQQAKAKQLGGTTWTNPMATLTPTCMRRYAYYFANMIEGVKPRSEPLVLRRVIINGIPDLASEDGEPAGCRPFLQLFQSGKLLYSSTWTNADTTTATVKASSTGAAATAASSTTTTTTTTTTAAAAATVASAASVASEGEDASASADVTSDTVAAAAGGGAGGDAGASEDAPSAQSTEVRYVPTLAHHTRHTHTQWSKGSPCPTAFCCGHCDIDFAQCQMVLPSLM